MLSAVLEINLANLCVIPLDDRSNYRIKDDRSNYRPISVLPFISMLFQKLIFNQFYEYLDANKSLYEHQSGFRLLHSVATSLMASTNGWFLNIDKGKYTGLIFIDFKKAFDTVDHEILLKN